MTNATRFSGRIGIIGSGALGGYYGARLARAGFDAHFLMRRDAEHVRRHGLRVDSCDGDFQVQACVCESAEALGICDLVIIGLKATDNEALAELLAPTVGPSTVVLTLQNGFGNEEAIARTLETVHGMSPAMAMERIIGGIAFLCSTRVGPGHIRHTAQGWVRLAEYGGAERERTRAIGAMFTAAGVRCELAQSVAAMRWQKLVWNIPFNGLGVAAERGDTASILADDELSETARELMREVIAAAAGEGHRIEEEFIETMLAATRTMEAYKSSMQLDYEAGRPLEVEAILGEPLRRAQRAGVATPRLQMLYGIVRRMDRLRRGL